MRTLRVIPLIALLLGALAAPVVAQGDLAVPYLTQRVTDLAGMIDEEVEERLEARLAAFEQETGAQVAVLTVADLDGEPIEDYSIRVVENWQLGREGVDDGVLLLIARDDRRMRIEVGYGLEGSLTDAMSRRILDNVITPRFRAGDFGGGVEAGVEAILSVIRGEELPAPVTPTTEIPLGCFLFMLIVFILFMVALTRLARRHAASDGRGWSSKRGWWIPTSGGFGGGGFSGGGFSGGGFSGGGGGFGGGGASGGW